MTDQPTYLPGHVKHDPATKAVAVRTQFPEDVLPDLAWLVATVNLGARNAKTADVADWDDLHTPEAGS